MISFISTVNSLLVPVFGISFISHCCIKITREFHCGGLNRISGNFYTQYTAFICNQIQWAWKVKPTTISILTLHKLAVKLRKKYLCTILPYLTALTVIPSPSWWAVLIHLCSKISLCSLCFCFLHICYKNKKIMN